ncbi:hypothetical protein WG904_11115 [Pedobacter sp. Du54]|uniref:hypothetical protein n=1 Tax=Pedobacter anseongensis TaxID=3133439 RepID=UPI0030AB8554
MSTDNLNIQERNGYNFQNAWFNFAETNADVKPIHTALYLFYVHSNNIIGWKIIEFGAPIQYAMEVLGIANRNTFKAAFNDLVKWGFVELVSASINQHNARRIKLCLFKNEQAKMNKHRSNQQSKQSTNSEPITKLLNNKIVKKENEVEEDFELIDFQDTDEYNAAVTFLKKHLIFENAKKDYGMSDAQLLKLYEKFYSQKRSFNELKNKTPDEFVKNFYYWIPKNMKAYNPDNIKKPAIRTVDSNAISRQALTSSIKSMLLGNEPKSFGKL